MIKTVAQFIPIIIIFLLISYFKSIAKFSNTVLGKLLAICVIIFYTTLDKLLGALVCLLVIFYYQSDLVENMLNLDSDLVNVVPEDIQADLDYVDDYVYLEKQDAMNKKYKKESMMNYVELYGDEHNKDILINNEKLQNEFRKNNCSKGELVNKDIPVNYEMTEHVFPEVKFRRGFCNPCLKDCEFSIIEQKLANEEKLRIPLIPK
jgi:hypothetical protein